jgi:DNA replication and repair protein RecF
MFLKKIHLTNFRNFNKLDLEFGSANLLLGKNAQGKSNLLEAVYFLATTKSPRAEKDHQLIKEGEEACLVFGEIDDIKLEIGMQVGEGLRLEKRVKVNGVARRSTDYIGNLVSVHFAPEDINLVTGPPALRRWHIDLTLAQIDKLYKNSLTRYHEAIMSRNRILKRIKEGIARVDELDFWSKQILDYGIVVAEKRRSFFESINDLKDGSDFKFDYHESILTEERLKEYLGREVAASNSLIGPHRDDFSFDYQSKNLAHFGSRGEQRTAVLDLKLAELTFIKQFKNTEPILLLDDVFSELDTAHQEHVIKAVSGQQTIISAVENENIPASFLKKVQIFRVDDGEITS